LARGITEEQSILLDLLTVLESLIFHGIKGGKFILEGGAGTGKLTTRAQLAGVLPEMVKFLEVWNDKMKAGQVSSLFKEDTLMQLCFQLKLPAREESIRHVKKRDTLTENKTESGRAKVLPLNEILDGISEIPEDLVWDFFPSNDVFQWIRDRLKLEIPYFSHLVAQQMMNMGFLHRADWKVSIFGRDAEMLTEFFLYSPLPLPIDLMSSAGFLLQAIENCLLCGETGQQDFVSQEFGCLLLTRRCWPATILELTNASSVLKQNIGKAQKCIQRFRFSKRMAFTETV